jgi:hypothetical protein
LKMTLFVVSLEYTFNIFLSLVWVSIFWTYSLTNICLLKSKRHISCISLSILSLSLQDSNKSSVILSAYH